MSVCVCVRESMCASELVFVHVSNCVLEHVCVSEREREMAR